MKPHHSPKARSHKVFILVVMLLVAIGAVFWMYENGSTASWPVVSAHAVEKQITQSRGLSSALAMTYECRLRVFYSVNGNQYSMWINPRLEGTDKVAVTRDCDSEIAKSAAYKLRYNPADPAEALFLLELNDPSSH